jgi:dihydrofolate reductase
VNRIIVIEFITLDGVIEDPDGSAGTPSGGWAFRYGPEAVAGDKFRLGPRLDTGALLFGRTTWQLFARIWPTRSDEFSTRMNQAPKWVASRTLGDVSAWANSALLQGELTEAVQQLRRDRDVIVIGSASVVHELMRHGLVDEYRLMIHPLVLGTGKRLFADGAQLSSLRFAEAAVTGGGLVTLTYQASG